MNKNRRKSIRLFLPFLLMLVILASFIGMAVPVGAASTGYQSGTTFTGSCSSPSNAQLSDDVRATFNSDGETLVASGFNLQSLIDSAATNITFVVQVEGRVENNDNTDNFETNLSYDGGSNWTTPIITTGSIEYQSYDSTYTAPSSGSYSNFNRTWSWTELSDGNFRVRITSNPDSSSENMYVDRIRVSVSYTPPPHTITASAGAGGSISPSGDVSVNDGATQPFTITKDSGCIVSDVVVDSVSQGGFDRYTFSSVTADHSIAASFDSGWNAASSNNGTGGGFNNPGNAYSSDNADATATNGETVNYGDFNIPPIPDGSQINGIAVSCEGYRSSSSLRYWTVSLSWDGSNFTSTQNTPDLGNQQEKTVTVGGSGNTWSRTWSAGELTNSNFKVHLLAYAGSSSANYLDQIQVKVYYTPSTSLAVSPASGTYGGTTDLSATLTSDGSPVSGKTIGFTVAGANAGSAVTNGSGVATKSYDLAGKIVNTYSIGASFAGDAGYLSSSGSNTLTVDQKSASVTPDPNSKVYGASDPVPITAGTLTGFLSGDNVIASYSRIPGETIAGGPYEISANLSPAGVLGNYDIDYNTADFVITPPGTWTGEYWYLNQDLTLVRPPETPSGTFEVPTGDTGTTWKSGVPASETVTFPKGTWTIFLKTDDWSDNCTAEIGTYSGGGFSAFATGAPDVSYADGILTIRITGDPINVDAGNYLALWVKNTSGTDQTIETDGDSFVVVPQSTPVWPVPELVAGLLLALGLAGIGGFIVIKRKKALKIH